MARLKTNMKKVLLSKWCRRCKKYIEAHYGVCPFCQDFLLEGKTKKVKNENY